MRGQRGITLVALVITIIVLLILAGVTIASITQYNFFGKAQDAANRFNTKAAEENETIDTMNNYLDQYYTQYK